MSWPIVTRRRLNAALAEIEQLRGRVAAAEQRHDETEAKRRNLARWLAEANAAKARLEGRNKALGDRPLEAQVASGFNPVEARRTAERIATLQKAAAAGREEAVIARAEARRERKRREELQKKYDEAVGLAPGGILNSGPWQPGYVEPTPTPKAAS